MGWFNASRSSSRGSSPAVPSPAAGDTCHDRPGFRSAGPLQKVSDCDLLGNGTSGAHGGSQLSSLGGTIRLGELLDTTGPIPHALKIELVASQYFWWQVNVTNYSSCWRWPARTCDGYAPARYRGTNPQLQPGSLLAVGVADAARVAQNLTTVPGKKILAAMRDYGAYVVDDIGASAEGAAFCAEHDVIGEVLTKFGWDIRYADDAGNALPAINATNNASVLYRDLLSIFQAISNVVNSGPDSIGGGGRPLVPLAPPLCRVRVKNDDMVRNDCSRVSDVKNFSAIGDGIHDDAAALLQAAVDWRASYCGGGVVAAPPGSYMYMIGGEAFLNILPNVTFRGEGVFTVLLSRTGGQRGNHVLVYLKDGASIEDVRLSGSATSAGRPNTAERPSRTARSGSQRRALQAIVPVGIATAGVLGSRWAVRMKSLMMVWCSLARARVGGEKIISIFYR